MKLGITTPRAWPLEARELAIPSPFAGLQLWWPALLLLPSLVAALAVRLPFLLAADFPINDGGLFYVMSSELAANGFRLPAFSSYNGDQIPFAYPPLGFYLAAFLHQGLGLPLEGILRVLPTTANLLTVVMFYLLARSVLGTWHLAGVAAVAFALLPRSFEWMVMGGGLTRSLGFLFAVAVLSQTRALLERPTTGRLAWCTVLTAGCLLSHLEMGLFLAYSYGLFLLVYGRRWQSLASSVVIAVGAGALSAPWWLSVIGMHGLVPFQAASGTSGWSYVEESIKSLVTLSFTDERLFPALAGLGALGLLPCLLRGNVLLPIWLGLIFLGTPRSAATEACVPLAMLIALAVLDLVVPSIAHLVQSWPAEQRALLQRLPSAVQHPARLRRIATGGALGLLFGYAVVLNTLAFTWDRHLLHALDPGERSAMSWVAEHTPRSAEFLLISPTQSWEIDYVFEWFPALAERRSVLTVQGTEWLPAKQHDFRVLYYNLVKMRGVSNVADLEHWARHDCVKFSHVYLSKAAHGPLNWALLQSSLVTSPEYRVLLNTPAALVLERTEPFPRRVQGYPVASDCRALVDEPADVQAAYLALYGDRAGQVWLEEHERAMVAAGPNPAATGSR